jgi:hypothetical protein
MVDQVGIAVRFDDHQAAGDVSIADEVNEGRVGRPEAVAAEDHQRVQVAFAHQAREVGLHGGRDCHCRWHVDIIVKFTLGG